MSNDKENNKLPLFIGIFCLLLVAVVAIVMVLPSADNNPDNIQYPSDNNTSVEVTPSLNDSETNDSVEDAKVTANYEGNSRTLIFHYPDCEWAEKISSNNLVKFKSRQEAVNQGYTACKVCKP